MAPRPIRLAYMDQQFVLDYDDDDPFDAELVKAQVFSLTDLDPADQHFEPALCPEHIDQILTLSSIGIDAQTVMSSIEWRSACSRIWLGTRSSSQPSAEVTTDLIPLCLVCARTCWTQTELQPRHCSDAFVCQCSERCLFRQRVVSGEETLVEPFISLFAQSLQSYQIRQDEAVLAHGRVQARLNANMVMAASFESGDNQRRALALIPVDTLVERGRVRSSTRAPRDQLVVDLLHWFKHEFFHWIDNPRCEHCGSDKTALSGSAAPTADEGRYGAGVTELYACRACDGATRFPRYNDSGKLMETRRGRCGEWAQAFVLCCRALQFKTRFVVDFTDHVWAEVWSGDEGRWVHCDPCENRYDAPLLYESGWGKKLTYVIAFSVDEVRDVTRRYTSKFTTDVLPRRRACDEAWLESTLNRHTAMMQRGRLEEDVVAVQEQWRVELSQLAGTEPVSSPDLAEALPGRQTGSLQWRSARGELGAAAPIRSEPLQPDPPKPTSKADLQDLVKRYFSQITTGCGDESCSNVDLCVSAKDSRVRDLDLKQRLGRCLTVVRESLGTRLCDRSPHPTKNT